MRVVAARHVLSPEHMLRRSFVVLAAMIVSCASNAPSSTSDFPDDAYASFLAGAEPALEVELRTAPAQPPERGEIAAEIRISDSEGAPRDGLAVDVAAFMGAHGHGTQRAPTVTPLGGGRYRVDDLELAMAGPWQLRFGFRGEGIDAHATANVTVR